MKYNKGEWSELFVVASIFNNNNIKIASSSNNIKILKVYFEDRKVNYSIYNSEINKDLIKIYPLCTNEEVLYFFEELSKSKGARQ